MFNSLQNSCALSEASFRSFASTTVRQSSSIAPLSNRFAAADNPVSTTTDVAPRFSITADTAAVKSESFRWKYDTELFRYFVSSSDVEQIITGIWLVVFVAGMSSEFGWRVIIANGASLEALRFSDLAVSPVVIIRSLCDLISLRKNLSNSLLTVSLLMDFDWFGFRTKLKRIPRILGYQDFVAPKSGSARSMFIVFSLGKIS